MPLRAIAKFPNVTKPWLARVGLAERIKIALSETLLGIEDPVALEAMSKGGFVEGDDTDYDVIREAIDRNREFFTKFSASSVN